MKSEEKIREILNELIENISQMQEKYGDITFLMTEYNSYNAEVWHSWNDRVFSIFNSLQKCDDVELPNYTLDKVYWESTISSMSEFLKALVYESEQLDYLVGTTDMEFERHLLWGINDNLEFAEKFRNLGMQDVVSRMRFMLWYSHVFLDRGYLNEDLTEKCLTENDFSRVNIIRMASESKNKLPEGIIDKDGVFYPIRTIHEEMVPLLIGLGIDLKDSVRVSISPFDGTLTYSSFDFLKDDYDCFENQESISITPAQAEVMYDFYESGRKAGYVKNSFSHAVTNSSNLGYEILGATIPNRRYYNSAIAEDNINLLFNAIMSKHPITEVHEDQSICGLLETIFYENRKHINQINKSTNSPR